ncbi:uncharacterized protein LOC142217277 [Leptodactylus fuscus]|uniref:uncharacterized protein LOC142217277 n=1 Tax=Leptodactylus fuscus TaxID=238119 RepID=UPI003F4EA81B
MSSSSGGGNKKLHHASPQSVSTYTWTDLGFCKLFEGKGPPVLDMPRKRTYRPAMPEEPRKPRMSSVKRELPVAAGHAAGEVKCQDAPEDPRDLVAESPYLEVLIEGQWVRCLIDTGSEVTTMPLKFFERNFGHLMKPEKDTLIKLTAVNQTAIPVFGVAWMRIELCGQDVGKKGVVLVEKPARDEAPVVLGMNILRELDQVMFSKEGPGYWKKATSHKPTRRAFQRLIRACGICKSTPVGKPIGTVYAPYGTTCTVPPRQEKIIRMPIGGNRKLNGIDVLIEPLGLSEASRSPVIARTIVSVADGQVLVRCINVHDYEVTFHAGEKVAELHVLQAETLTGRQLALRVVKGDAWTLAVDQNFEEEPTPEWNGQRILEQMEIDASQFTSDQMERIEAVLWEFQSAFSRSEEDFGCTTAIEHEISTGDTPPIRERYRQIPPTLYQEVKTMLSQMIDSGIVKESQSPWAAPVVLVRKKDGSLRFCVDYRKLNAATVKDAFPLPRIEESLTALQRAKYFSTLDLASGYWQVPVAEKDRQKTAFILPMGLYEFNRMPFGLTNAPGTFQRLMEHCLGELNFESILIYLDDVIVHAPTFEEHLRRLRQVLSRLRAHGLKIKPRKCHLFQTSIEYLGHEVSAEGVRPADSKVEAVSKWPQPKTLREVRAFLGLAGYYRRFIKGFAKIAGPLHELLRGTSQGPKTRPISWGPPQQQAFDELKKALTSAPILAFAQFDRPFILYTDGSLHGLGAVLAQEQEGQERVIAYASRSLRDSERNPDNYSSFRLELLALVWAMTEKFSGYLTGAHVLVRTDNNPLAHLQNAKLGALEQRWMARLAKYNYTIKYRAGKDNTNADALSRVTWEVPVREVDEENEGTEIPDLSRVPRRSPLASSSGVATGGTVLLGKTEEEWAQVQDDDSDLRKIKYWVKMETWPNLDMRNHLSSDGWKLRWPEYLPELLWAYNNRVHNTTGYTPYMLLFGRPGQEITEMNLNPPSEEITRTAESWVKEHRDKLRTIQRVVNERLQKQVPRDHQPVQTVPLLPGERVLVRERRPTNKLDHRWESQPYIVKRQVFSEGPVYDVQAENSDGPTRRLHRNMLRPCLSEGRSLLENTGEVEQRRPDPKLQYYPERS